ncbi:TAXI family TRAP transporter solute-binding subunit [Propylenella binzhouense]|uniref:TAXI family TRAP transporter solute-binding subunit n=1 Tax=Propylenella binzhouense TaxID=2555902 RepID=A0A964T6S9_9HYPH|nr:TAXI family TRAP transporter solute-binding subunit [Propylenella binzhouense]MYZ48962.1 TAXI family TRAP transporter solute-binding subunit [Propylenella binzhouense]
MKFHVAAAVIAFGLASAGAAQAQTVGIATSNPGSIFHNIGSAVANAANKAGLNATIQPATSPNQYIPAVASGDIEFGVANLQEVNYALEGREWFSGSVNPDLRLVALIMPLKEAIFVRADSDIRTIADLKGKPMVDGYTAQQTILPQLDAMYATAGLTRADMRPVQVPSVVAGADAFMAGESAGFIFAHSAGKVREADAAVGGLRALPIENTPENLAAVRKFWPVAFFTRMKPGKNNPGVQEEAWFLAYPQIVFTSTHASEEDVYKMTKVLYENKDALVQTFPPFAAFDPKEMVGEIAPSEYHPGAIRFYKEVGLWKE